MRILQIVHGFSPEFVAGTEQYCEVLSRHLLRERHTCLVLAGSERSAQEATLATVDQDGLLVTRYLRAEARPSRWTEEYDAEAERLTRHLLALVRPDVVHLHHWQRLTNNLVAICADRGIPVVVTLHDVWTSCPRIHRVRWDGAFCPDPPAAAPCLTCAERAPWQGDREILNALALRREIVGAELALAKAIIVPSEAHRAFLLNLLELPENRLTVLPHGSLPLVAARQGSGEGVKFPHRPLQIGHWGYLVYVKGPHLILEAVHQLRDPSAVQVHLIGTTIEPDYEQRLRELARGIPVQFHGAYQPADLPAFDLDIAVLPSIASESYSFALDEALRLGLPALVSDRGAPPDRIGAAGLTFRAGDSEDLAGRLQQILDTPELLDAMRHRIRPDTLLSMEAHVVMLEKIYKDATHVKKSRHKSPTPYLKLITHANQQVKYRDSALAELQAQIAAQEATIAALTREHEAERGRLTQEHEAERGRLRAEFAHVAEERAAEARARQAAETRSAELDVRLAAAEAAAVTLTQEHEAERGRLRAEFAHAAEERAAEARARQAAETERIKLSDELASLEETQLIQVQDLERKIEALIETRDGVIRRLTEVERTPAARLQALLKRWGRPKGATR